MASRDYDIGYLSAILDAVHDVTRMEPYDDVDALVTKAEVIHVIEALRGA